MSQLIKKEGSLIPTEENLRQDGWEVFVISTEGADVETFFHAVRKSLPLDPPLLGSHSWDAMSDSLWSGLNELDSQRIALYWMKTCKLRGEADQIALAVLTDVARALRDPEATAGLPKAVRIFVDQIGLPAEERPISD